MGNFLENVIDWGLSASATGARRCRSGCATCGHIHVIGSIAELKSMSDDCPDEIELHKALTWTGAP